MKTSSAYLLVLPFRKRTVDGSSKVLVGCVTLGPVVQNRHVGYTIFGSCTLYKQTDNDCSLLYIQIKSISAICIPQMFHQILRCLQNIILILDARNNFYILSRRKSLKQKKKMLAKETEFS